jgi:hypothetical protein
MLLPPGGAVGAWAALRLSRAAFFDGLLSDGETARPVPLNVGPGHARRRRDGITWIRDVLHWEEVWVRSGIACVRPTRAVFDEMRLSTDVRAAAVALDMACAAEATSISRVRRYAESHPGVNGVPLVRTAIELADEDSWSPGESRLRLTWVLDARCPRPLANREVFGSGGRLLGVADLIDPDAAVVGEYDGGEHARPGRRSRDAARDSAFRDAGLEVFRVTAYDEHYPARLVDRIRAAYRRAAASGLEKRWTLEPTPGADRRLTLDERIELRDVLRDLDHAADRQPRTH